MQGGIFSLSFMYNKLSFGALLAQNLGTEFGFWQISTGCYYQIDRKEQHSQSKKKKKIYLAISYKDNVHRRNAYFQNGP